MHPKTYIYTPNCTQHIRSWILCTPVNRTCFLSWICTIQSIQIVHISKGQLGSRWMLWSRSWSIHPTCATAMLNGYVWGGECAKRLSYCWWPTKNLHMFWLVNHDYQQSTTNHEGRDYVGIIFAVRMAFTRKLYGLRIPIITVQTKVYVFQCTNVSYDL